MSKRRKLIVGNWKMNGRLTAGLNIARDLVEKAGDRKPLAYDVVICPPATLLWPIAETIMGTPILLGAQDCHYANHGAYTGNISAGMIADLGGRFVILGHSERRTGNAESNALIAKKVAAAQMAGLTVILCIGETLEERASGRLEPTLVKQLSESLPDQVAANQLVIAYEPVWAIGSGEQPTLDDICLVNRLIRRTLGVMGGTVQILYGGSVTGENAGDLLTDNEIDGVLVGGASLSSDGFWSIALKCGSAYDDEDAA